MKIAIMQPYLFPYIGYFQLVNAVDKFIFYDDVDYINKGWINRNKIIANNKPYTFTIPLKGASQNRLIKDIEIHYENKDIKKILKTLKFNYSSAPNYDKIFPLVENVLTTQYSSIGAMAADSVERMSEFMGVEVEFGFSSNISPESRDMNKADRLIHITKKEGSSHYINSIGGRELYDKENFKDNGVKLEFLNPDMREYQNQEDSFTEGLSIIDVAMWCSKDKLQEQLENYSLV